MSGYGDMAAKETGRAPRSFPLLSFGVLIPFQCTYREVTVPVYLEAHFWLFQFSPSRPCKLQGPCPSQYGRLTCWVRPLGSRCQEGIRGARHLLAVTSGKDGEVKREELVKENLQVGEGKRGLQGETKTAMPFWEPTGVSSRGLPRERSMLARKWPGFVISNIIGLWLGDLWGVSGLSMNTEVECEEAEDCW